MNKKFPDFDKFAAQVLASPEVSAHVKHQNLIEQMRNQKLMRSEQALADEEKERAAEHAWVLFLLWELLNEDDETCEGFYSKSDPVLFNSQTRFNPLLRSIFPTFRIAVAAAAFGRDTALMSPLVFDAEGKPDTDQFAEEFAQKQLKNFFRFNKSDKPKTELPSPAQTPADPDPYPPEMPDVENDNTLTTPSW